MNMRPPNPSKLLLLIVCITFFLDLQAQQKPEILWDNYGVPHIYGKTIEDTYFGFGWAQMHNHADLILQLYGTARGRAAEYWGEQFVESDRLTHLLRLPEEAPNLYARQTPESKKILDAFVAGMNAYAKAHPDKIGDAVKQVLPIKAADVLAHIAREISEVFVAGGDLGYAMDALKPGSNSLAIAPSRSTSGHAMLMANPHLPWSDLFLFFEAHLNAPGFQVYGASLVGQPVINIGFNENLGWTHTVNTIDASDLYILTEKDNGYLLDGKVKPFETIHYKIKVKEAGNHLKERDIACKYSAQGPVLGEKNGKAFAIRIAGLRNALVAAEWHAMAKASNRTEFEKALQMLQIPMFNVVYADKQGDILYLFNGNVPIRPTGDWQFWQSPVDGTKSSLIWNKTHPYKDLPRVLNPTGGFVANANDAPWTCTYPLALDHTKFPAYMAPFERPSLRPQRGVNLVLKKDKLSLDDLADIKMNTGLEAADRWLDELLAAGNQFPDTSLTEAITVLKAWDRSADVNSKGTILYMIWFSSMDENAVAVPWDPKDPFNTPKGLKDPKAAVEILKKAVAETRKRFGRLDATYGDVFRFRIKQHDVPGNGGPGDQFGIYRTLYFSADKDKTMVGVAGDSYVALVEFGPRVIARVSLSYGNATQNGSTHVGDQLDLMTAKKLRPALLTKEEIMKNLEEKE